MCVFIATKQWHRTSICVSQMLMLYIESVNCSAHHKMVEGVLLFLVLWHVIHEPLIHAPIHGITHSLFSHKMPFTLKFDRKTIDNF